MQTVLIFFHFFSFSHWKKGSDQDKTQAHIAERLITKYKNEEQKKKKKTHNKRKKKKENRKIKQRKTKTGVTEGKWHCCQDKLHHEGKGGKRGTSYLLNNPQASTPTAAAAGEGLETHPAEDTL